jgi:hypothetical protein
MLKALVCELQKETALSNTSIANDDKLEKI